MSLNIFSQFEIENNLKVSNNLEVLQDINVSKNVSLTGTDSILNLRTIKSNIPTSGAYDDPSGNYIDISGSTLLIPRGTTAERMSVDPTGMYGATAKAGMIMYDTNQNQFVGVVGKSDGELVWTGLGGVISLDQRTRVEASNVLDSDGIKFYADDVQRMIINKDGNFGFGDVDELVDNSLLSLPSGMDFTFYKTADPKILISSSETTNTKGLVMELDSENAFIHNNADNGDLILGTNNSGRMYIDYNGYVGIGTDSPGTLLHIHKDTAGGSAGGSEVDGNKVRLKITGSTDHASPGIELFEDAGTDGATNSRGCILKFDGQANAFKINMFGSVGEIEALSIKRDDGNVGIGTTSPGAPLHLSYTGGLYNGVQGFINEATSGRSTTRLRSNDDNPSELFFDVNGAIRWDFSCRANSNNYDMYIYNSPSASSSLTSLGSGFTPVMVLTQTARVGIGITSPGVKLHIKPSSGGDGIQVKSHNGGADVCHLVSNSTGKGTLILNDAGNNTQVQLVGDSSADDNYIMGNVGIGTDSPDNTLHIHGGDTTPSTFNNVVLRLTGKGQGNGGSIGMLFNMNRYESGAKSAIFSKDYAGGWNRSSLVFCTNNEENNNDATLSDARMTIRENGNVGIGTTSPNSKLEIAGDMATTNMGTNAALRLSVLDSTSYATNGMVGIMLSTSYQAAYTNKYGISISAMRDGDSNQSLIIKNHKNSEAGTDILKIDKDGNVGIGTTSPLFPLEIGAAPSTNAAYLGTVFKIVPPSAAYSGGVGITINGTGANSHNNSTWLEFVPTNTNSEHGKTCFIGAEGDSSTTHCSDIVFKFRQPSGGYRFNTTTERMRISHGGNVGIGISSPSYKLDVDGTIGATGDITAFHSSDKRLKNNLIPIKDPLEKLKKINGYTFVWKENEHHPNKGSDIGVVAQEVEEILPEVTTTRQNGYKAVRYEKLTPFLISCIKEQQTQIENQQTQISSLQHQIDELKALIQNKL